MSSIDLNSLILDEKRRLFLVKDLVDEVYNKQKIFGLSLETLELTRRFDNLYSKLMNIGEIEYSQYRNLLSITGHLERNLSQELG